jgi:uncharacterized membrane protein
VFFATQGEIIVDGLSWFPIATPVGVLATLTGVCAFFYWLEKATRWRLFQVLPPLAFIYLVPVILSNTGFLVSKSPVYDVLRQFLLPMLLVLLLINVDIGAALRVMGRGIGVMLFGTLGVMLGAPIGLLAVKNWLGPDAWKAFGALSGSWTGGTGNLVAVATMVNASGADTGLALLADSIMYSVWLPILLIAKKLAGPFDQFTGVESDRVERMLQAAEAERVEPRITTTRDYLFLFCIALVATWIADLAAGVLPNWDPYLTAETWRILLITTIGITLSLTPLRLIHGSQELGMAFVCLFVARTGASADLTGVTEQALPFLLGALLMILVHGAFCLLGAWLLRSDIHTAAIGSAANIGGVAASSIVAQHHQPSLVPAAILLALFGIAIGNYCGYLTALLCRLVM